jgi:hypothetical protein
MVCFGVLDVRFACHYQRKALVKRKTANGRSEEVAWWIEVAESGISVGCTHGAFPQSGCSLS